MARVETATSMSGKLPAPARAEGSTVDLSAVLLPSEYPRFYAARQTDRTALKFQDWTWSYAALDRACDGMVSLLREVGVGPGDRVAYKGRNNDLFFIVLIGCIRAGAVLVPVNWRNTAAETRYVLNDSGTKLLLADAAFLALLDPADTQSRAVIVTNDDGPAGLRARLAQAVPAGPDAPETLAPHDACLQLYTSGTTGKPKGVLTSQYALGAHRAVEIASPGFDDWGDDETLLSPMPNFHVGGMSWVLCGLARGQTVVITAETAPPALLELSVRYAITRIFIVPTVLRALLEEMNRRDIRLPRLRGIHYGAMSMDAALLEQSVDKIGCRFLQYYGMTEATGTITLLQPRHHDLARPHLLRSVGQPLPGFTIEIRGPDQHLLAINQPGEIWVRGPGVMLGYWNLPGATAEVLQDGWYRTGDGGMLDAEGFLFITDRIKDMISSGGENVYPAEVEAALRQHPSVLDCAVFGLPHPQWGEAVTAAVELRPGQAATQEALVAFARTLLAGYKVPRRIEIGVVLPRTASGKVQRAALRKQYLA
jgi:acyl-CoA synthetase (AMP-forming)/AMP-acid ligase II